MTAPGVDAVSLAQGQLQAAWVSATAAVLQSVGAVGAIVVTAHIARSSERRAGAAERAADERTRNAEKAADERVKRTAIQAHNALIQDAVSLADDAIEILKGRQRHRSEEKARSTFMGLELLPKLDDVQEALRNPPIGASMSSDTKRSIAELRRAADRRPRVANSGSGKLPEGWATYFGVWVDDVRAARALVEATLHPANSE